jgi:hypothetical protein
MFENIQNSLNGFFGKLQPGMCRLTMNGGIAVKCSNGYKTYNVKKGTLTNVTNFCFNIGDEMFFMIPTTKVAVGDIILVGGKPKCVTEIGKKSITVIDYESSEERKIIPERHVFMGSTYFYAKIFSWFGNAFKNGKGLGNAVKMMMMSQVFGGNGNGANNMGGMGSLLAMSMLANGKDGSSPFEGMFDGMFDFDVNIDTPDEEGDDDENDNEEE